jgi:hypothetical protein
MRVAENAENQAFSRDDPVAIPKPQSGQTCSSSLVPVPTTT